MGFSGAPWQNDTASTEPVIRLWNDARMKKRETMKMEVLCKVFVGCLVLSTAGWGQEQPDVKKGETLYNGIQLPAVWPPRLTQFPTSVERDPVVPPYLVSPPAVIPIDVGRQLFVDDFLIADTTLTRTFHQPVYHEA